jgi:hypothetical protein
MQMGTENANFLDPRIGQIALFAFTGYEYSFEPASEVNVL